MGKWYAVDKVGRYLVDLDSPVPKSQSWSTIEEAEEACHDIIERVTFVYLDIDPAEYGARTNDT